MVPSEEPTGVSSTQIETVPADAVTDGEITTEIGIPEIDISEAETSEPVVPEEAVPSEESVDALIPEEELGEEITDIFVDNIDAGTSSLPVDEQEAVDDAAESADLFIDDIEEADDAAEEVEDEIISDEDVENTEGETASANVLKAEGTDYRVTISYTDEAEIPEGAELQVTEILSDENDYDTYLNEAADALSTEERIMSIDHARFFDIKIADAEGYVEPKAPVTVLVELEDSYAAAEEDLALKAAVTEETDVTVEAEEDVAFDPIVPGVMVKSTEEKEKIYNSSFQRVKYGSDTYIILETGYSYEITEDDIDLHFELDTDIYHPMVVNGTLRTVKSGVDDSGNRVITDISQDSTGLTTLTATNNLKGGLDVQKFVTTKDDASDFVTTDETFFTFKIKLQKSSTDPTPVYTTRDQFDENGKPISGSLGFRVFAAPVIPQDATNIAEDGSSYVFDGLIYNADRNDDEEIISYTAGGTIPNSGEVTLKIRQSKPGGTEDNLLDRIRIVK